MRLSSSKVGAWPAPPVKTSLNILALLLAALPSGHHDMYVPSISIEAWPTFSPLGYQTLILTPMARPFLFCPVLAQHRTVVSARQFAAGGRAIWSRPSSEAAQLKDEIQESGGQPDEDRQQQADRPNRRRAPEEQVQPEGEECRGNDVQCDPARLQRTVDDAAAEVQGKRQRAEEQLREDIGFRPGVRDRAAQAPAGQPEGERGQAIAEGRRPGGASPVHAPAIRKWGHSVRLVPPPYLSSLAGMMIRALRPPQREAEYGALQRSLGVGP